MYMALYRLKDGEAGIDELDQWLRNVQVSSGKKYAAGFLSNQQQPQQQDKQR